MTGPQSLKSRLAGFSTKAGQIWKGRDRQTIGTTPPNTRIYAIGDIHGHDELLAGLWYRILEDSKQRGTSKRVKIIITGDFIDRGRGSKQIIQRLRRTQKDHEGLTVLLGNHEWALLESLRGNAEIQAEWLEHGGGATLESYGIHIPKNADQWQFAQALAEGLGEEIVDWLRGLPISMHLGTYFFAHAGVLPGKPLGQQSEMDMLSIRNDFMDCEEGFGAVIVHGHNRVDSVEIRPNRISLDTGAFETGMLSAIGLEDGEQWTLTYSA